jgi:threonine dehydrogenase-like Zn-dependent dehydrogenase
VNVCLASLRARGRLVLFSAIHDAPRVDLFRVHLNELEVVGACNDEEFLDDALYCLSDPKLSVGELITHEFPLYQWERAFDLARAGKDRALKVALTFERSR